MRVCFWLCVASFFGPCFFAAGLFGKRLFFPHYPVELGFERRAGCCRRFPLALEIGPEPHAQYRHAATKHTTTDSAHCATMQCFENICLVVGSCIWQAVRPDSVPVPRHLRPQRHVQPLPIAAGIDAPVGTRRFASSSIPPFFIAQAPIPAGQTCFRSRPTVPAPSMAMALLLASACCSDR